ncbi:MAG: 3-hydroxyacyl-CoA dehydrogenase NAD-binding domain-containing protein, partial [Planctomycetota bacterium]|nr:3-hydroxyacyl-CoA dehydrogenase NAD-binding domain-containing protein [Planctomycetota bacterium]
VGGGTMGAGIAQLASANGCAVELLEIDVATAQKAIDGIGKRFDRQVEKRRMSEAEAAEAKTRLHIASGPGDLADCDFVIEAVVEEMGAKVEVLSAIRDAIRDDARGDTIFASNTSSLSITKLGEALGMADRVCGMHFFNPAPVMPLVEIIAGAGTAAKTVDRAAELAEGWGKPVVRVKDTPGFIVNRVARPFYLESLRIIEERLASCDAVDLLMKEVAGFKMGPFELMDLVGIDINYAVTCSVYEQSGQPARFKPSETQARLVDQGKLGRKTGVGFYSYERDKPEIAYRLDAERVVLSARLGAAVLSVTQAAGWEIEPESGYVPARILCALMNEAALAEEQGVATEADIDVAMKLGTSYPQGPLAWARAIGHQHVGLFLRAMNEAVGDDRFAPAKRFA